MFVYIFFPPLNRCYSYHSPSPYSRRWYIPGGWAGVWTSWYFALPERGSRGAAHHWHQSEGTDELQRKEGLRDTRYKPRTMWWIHSCNSGRTDLFWHSESNIIAGSAASNFGSFLPLFTGYVLGLIMMVIIIAIGAGIVVGYIYKRWVALCSKTGVYRAGMSEHLQSQPDPKEMGQKYMFARSAGLLVTLRKELLKS